MAMWQPPSWRAVHGSPPTKVTLDYGHHVQPGVKVGHPAHMVDQDEVLVVPLTDEQVLVGVFDGHGPCGRQIAEQTRDLFAGSGSAAVSSSRRGELPGTLGRLFGDAHRMYVGLPLAKVSGTTATVAVVNAASGSVTCAHVGDSSLLVAHPDGHIEFVTEDHDFNSVDVARCAANGGEVREFNNVLKTVRRVYRKGGDQPALALARSIGDLDAHAVGVLHEPSVRECVPLEPGGVVILATDGVWNILHKDIAVQLALDYDAQVAARAIAEEAYRRWPQGDYIDDIAVVVVKAVPVDSVGEGAEDVCCGPGAKTADGALLSHLAGGGDVPSQQAAQGDGSYVLPQIGHSELLAKLAALSPPLPAQQVARQPVGCRAAASNGDSCQAPCGPGVRDKAVGGCAPHAQGGASSPVVQRPVSSAKLLASPVGSPPLSTYGSPASLVAVAQPRTRHSSCGSPVSAFATGMPATHAAPATRYAVPASVSPAPSAFVFAPPQLYVRADTARRSPVPRWPAACGYRGGAAPGGSVLVPVGASPLRGGVHSPMPGGAPPLTAAVPVWAWGASPHFVRPA